VPWWSVYTNNFESTFDFLVFYDRL